MNQPETLPRTPPDPTERQAHLDELASDETYWDYLDTLELDNGGSREWDNPCGG
jgi:hypothetical protein